MSVFDELSRRQFLSLARAAATATVINPHPLARLFEQAADTSRNHTIPAPINIPKGPQPLFRGHTGRPLRYMPVDRDFVIENGSEFFNRPLYGRNNDFRVDVGDRPEFSLYLPGHRGNIQGRLHYPRWRPVGNGWRKSNGAVPARTYDLRDKRSTPFPGHDAC